MPDMRGINARNTAGSKAEIVIVGSQQPDSEKEPYPPARGRALSCFQLDLPACL